MKKFVFAVQVFGVIAMFPIYVILEMNHGTGRLPDNSNHPVVKEKVEKNIIQVSINSEPQNENSITGEILTRSTGPISKHEIIKALAKAGYKAY